ncbi:MAG: O-antigen ligase family protein [Clostridium sp.]|nr:O-antigen ligase family protein [Clostridium sp.]
MNQAGTGHRFFNFRNLQQYIFNIPFLLFCIAPFCLGLFYEGMCAATAILLGIWLWRQWRKKGYMDFYINPASVAVVVLWLGYVAAVAWAVDKGIAAWGIIKYLPVVLFLVSVMQMPKQMPELFLHVIPISGCLMTISSGLLAITPWKDFVFVNGRLAGFFQYPNTYAIYLLAGLIVLFIPEERTDREKKKEENAKYYIRIVFVASVLMAGIFLSGSRTVFILLVLTVGISIFVGKQKKVKWLMAGIFGILLLAVVLYALLSDKESGISRFLSISWQSSAFLGRILYMQDAWHQIMKEPLGLGYMGYFFSQCAFQTGVYTVRFVHNDILQIFLDAGWIPGIFFLGIVFSHLLSKTISLRCRIIMLMLFLHGMLDFDLQYIAVFFVWIICMEVQKGKRICLKYQPCIGAFFIGIAMGCFYLGIAACCLQAGGKDVALTIYPWNTFAMIEDLKMEKDSLKAEETAARILKQNPYVSVAWSARARAAYANGDFENVIKYKKKAIEYNRYDIEEYIDYYEMLKVGIQLYGQNGDMESATICLKELQNIQTMIKASEDAASRLAWQIDEKPELEMPEEYDRFLE